MRYDLPLITCPKCGQQYLPSEIYLPTGFFGKQKEIVRKPSGEIDFYVGDDMDLDEEFICDHCGSKLKIHANLNFEVITCEDFDEEYETQINKAPKIKLNETELF